MTIASTLIRRHNQPRDRVQLSFKGQKSKTKQSFAKECDINEIMAKYQKTGAIAHVNQHGAEYGFATSHDFSSAMRLITQAQDMFAGLPSSIRNRFANDPAQFLDFVQDADNAKEMQTLGLLPEDPTPEQKKALKTPPKENPPEEKTDTTPKEE